MPDLADLRRPRLLVRAARSGLKDYRRTPTLARLIGEAGDLDHERRVAALRDREAACDALRRSGDATYSVARHVEILIALIAEARALAAA